MAIQQYRQCLHSTKRISGTVWVRIKEIELLGSSGTEICSPEESIAPLDHSLRVLFESRCEVSFPCAKERCQIDFSQLCPSDWTAVVDDDTCIVSQSKIVMIYSKRYQSRLQEHTGEIAIIN